MPVTLAETTGQGPDLDSAAEALGGLLGETEEPIEEEIQDSQDDQEIDESDDVEEIESDEESEDEGEETEADEQETIVLDSLEKVAETTGLSVDDLMDMQLSFRAADEDVTVSLAEMRSGYQKDADYRRRTTQLAESRRAMEAEIGQREQMLAQQGQLYEALIMDVGNMVAGDKNSPAMLELRNTNPAEWSARMNEIDLRERGVIEMRNRLAGALQQQQQHVSAEQAKALKALKDAESARLVDAIPDWSNEVAGQITNYLGNYGYGEELGSIMDHRQLVIARKAMLYDEAQKVGKTGQKKVVRLQKTSKPAKGRSKQGGTGRRVAKAKQAHAKSQSLDTAAALINEIKDL